MSNLNRHPVRRAAAGVLASTLALSGVAIAAGVSPANAAPGFSFDRVAGNDRYETSAATSARYRAAATAGLTNVIMASGEAGRTPDSLAASFLAGVRNAPVLLTRRDTTPTQIATELAALKAAGVTTITVVGGPVAVSDVQLATLRGLGFTVNRLGGVDRFATARLIAAAGESAPASNVGLVASGVSTIDALAGGPLAYKGKHQLFLVTRDGIPASTLSSLRESGVTSVYILGGEAVVGRAVVAQLASAGVTVTARLAGQDRSATSVAIAEAIIANFGFDKTTFNLASGANEGVDALGGAALSGLQNRAILITNTADSAPPVISFATRNAALLTARGLIFGGPAVVTPALEAAIVAAGGGSAGVNNQTFTVSSTGDNTIALGGDAASRTRVYTVTVPAGTVVDIKLFASANVTTTGAVTTFADPNSDNEADNGTTTGATITSVNGVPGATTDNITSGGTITFSVTGTAAVSVTPVVFADAADDDSLGLVVPATANANPKAPRDAFGVGASVSFIAANAPLGTSTPTVTSVNAAQDFFSSAEFSYRYDANDVFQFQGVPITLDQFESLLSTGDVLAVSYSPTAAGVSTFNVTSDAAATAPGAPTTAVSNLDGGATANDVRVTYTRPASNAAGATYTLQRRLASAADNTYATVASATQAAGTGTGVFVFTDANVANGVYLYRVVVTNPVSGGTTASGNSVATTVPAIADTTRPTSNSTRLVTNGGFSEALDTNDVFRIVLSEPVTVASGAALRLRDGEGDAYQLTNGGNATLAVNAASVTLTGSDAGTYAAGEVLTVTVTGVPTPISGATAADLPVDFPLFITDSAGIADAAGNAFNPGVNTGFAFERQQATNTGSAGTYTLTFAGQTTTALAFNATVAQVDAALEALSNITDVDVVGTSGSYSVTFSNPGGDVAQLTADNTSLTGGTVSVTTTTQGSFGTGGTVITNS